MPTAAEWERRVVDRSVPGGWRIASPQEKADLASAAAARKSAALPGLLLTFGSAAAAGLFVAGPIGLVVAPAAVFALMLALGNR